MQPIGLDPAEHSQRNVMSRTQIFSGFAFMLGIALAAPALSAEVPHLKDCEDLPSYSTLKQTLAAARGLDNGGLNNEMWGAVVNRSGVVCAVAFTGAEVGDQWPGSRLIAVEKANTANALSLPKSAFSTANLFYATEPTGFMAGLRSTNPVNLEVAYRGHAIDFGSEKDPLVGGAVGGLVTFGGGLALYDREGKLLGALGVSGDTSCADHNIAWRTRAGMNLDYVPGGVSKDKSDQIIYDIHLGKSLSGFGHPTCGNKEESVSKKLPKIRARSKS